MSHVQTTDRQWRRSERVAYVQRMIKLSNNSTVWRTALDILGGPIKPPRYNPKPEEFEDAVKARGQAARAAFIAKGGKIMDDPNHVVVHRRRRNRR